jgi:hypothetical protein
MITLATAMVVFAKGDALLAPAWLLYLACSIITVMLFLIYASLSRAAGIARGVARELEIIPDSATAISSAYLLAQKPNPYSQRRGNIYKVVLAITVFISLAMIGLSYRAYAKDNMINVPQCSTTDMEK